MKKWWPVLFLPLLVCVVYHRAYYAQFVLWDDDALIMNNAMLNMPLWGALTTAFTIYYHGDYFPLTLMSYWTDIQLFGVNARAMHLENLFLQALNVSLLYVFLKKITESHIIALVTSLFYAIHPLQTETVMWISERKSLISAFFTFASLNFYLESYSTLEKKRRVFLGLAVLFYVLAGLAKATSILLPGLFILIDFYKIPGNRKRQIFRALPSLLCAAGLIFMRITAYSVSVGNVAGDLFSFERILNIPTMSLNAIGFYLQKFFVPRHLAALYINYELTDVVIVWSIAVFVLLAVLAFLIKKQRDLSSKFFFLWFILFLIPVLQIFPRINYVNDRYMYLPIIGFVATLLCLFSAKWISAMIRYQVWIVIILALALGIPSYGLSKVWETNENLWLNVIENYPGSVIAHNNLGLDYQDKGQFEKAIKHYTTILGYSVNDKTKLLAYNNLANVYSDPRFLGRDFNRTIALLKEGLSKVARMRDSYEMRANLAITYKKTKQFEMARVFFQDLLKDLKNEPDYRFQWLVPIIQTHMDTLPK